MRLGDRRSRTLHTLPTSSQQMSTQRDHTGRSLHCGARVTRPLTEQGPGRAVGAWTQQADRTEPDAWLLPGHDRQPPDRPSDVGLGDRLAPARTRDRMRLGWLVLGPRKASASLSWRGC